jgi:hypothetical protein
MDDMYAVLVALHYFQLLAEAYSRRAFRMEPAA